MFQGEFAGGFSGGNAGGAGDKRKKFRYQNITPVTAANIKEMSFDDQFIRLGDYEISQVKVIGTVIQVEKTQTCTTYKVDDTTGMVTAKHWVSFESQDDNEMEVEEPFYEEGTLVKIFAQVRSFQKNITLNAIHVEPIEDLNEMTAHILECIKFKLVGEAKKKSSKTNPSDNFGNVQDGGFQNQVSNMGMDTVQTQVWKLIEACKDGDGISINEIRSQLKGLNINQIRNSLEFLSNEGHIYSTIDEDHFRSTS